MRKVYFENTYTEFIDSEDIDFLYEMISLFFDYNENRLESEEDKEVVEHILKELEFVRTVPEQLRDEMEDFEDLTIADFFEEVRSVVEMVLENVIEEEKVDQEDEMGLMDGLSARVALGLGLKYEDEVENENNLIKVKYDEDDEEILISNLILPEDQAGEENEDFETGRNEKN